MEICKVVEEHRSTGPVFGCEGRFAGAAGPGAPVAVVRADWVGEKGFNLRVCSFEGDVVVAAYVARGCWR